MIVNQQSLNGLFSGFNTLFNKGFGSVSPQYLQVAMTVPSSSRDETYAWLGQFPMLREWIGGREIQSLSAHSYTIQNRNFELTLEVPRNDIMDDKIGIYSPLFQNMGEAARMHPDSLVFNLMANGFTLEGYDGTPFFSQGHPAGDGHQSNMGTKKLTAESYEEARVSMMTLKGDHGYSLKIVPDLLVVAPQNEAKAKELLFSDMLAGSTNVNKDTCGLMVSAELADFGDQWYLLSTKRSLKPFIFQEREKPRFTSKAKDSDDNVFFQDSFIYGVNARYNAGFGLWQLAYGSTGTEEGGMG